MNALLPIILGASLGANLGLFVHWISNRRRNRRKAARYFVPMQWSSDSPEECLGFHYELKDIRNLCREAEWMSDKTKVWESKKLGDTQGLQIFYDPFKAPNVAFATDGRDDHE